MALLIICIVSSSHMDSMRMNMVQMARALTDTIIATDIVMNIAMTTVTGIVMRTITIMAMENAKDTVTATHTVTATLTIIVQMPPNLPKIKMQNQTYRVFLN